MYIRKTRDEYTLQGDYGFGGWEDLTTEDTWKEIRQRRKEYRENDYNVHALRIIKRRVPIEQNQ